MRIIGIDPGLSGGIAIVKMLEILEEDDDVQNTFVNCNIHIN